MVVPAAAAHTAATVVPVAIIMAVTAARHTATRPILSFKWGLAEEPADSAS